MTSTNPVRVAVIGGGYMGGGIAQTFAAHGFDCLLADASAELSRTRTEQLHREARRFAADGLIPEGMADRIAEHLRPADSLQAAVADATYVSEVVPEKPDLKKQVLAAISSLTGPEVVIGSNTSAIRIGELATSVRHPERFLGVHWMNPAPFVPCVEVIPATGTAEDVVRRAVALIRQVGKVPTVVADVPGFVANRLQYALFREASRIVEEGVATPADIDEVVSNSFGFRLPFFGPFAIADIAGLDVYRDGFSTMEAAYGERIGTPQLLRDQVDAGRHGLKTGQGFFDYQDGQAAEVAHHRDRAYAALTRLRGEVAPAGSAEPAAPRD